MSILAIDFGIKKIGIAICNDSQIPRPLKIIKYKSIKEVAKEISKLCQDNSASKVIIGDPLKNDGTRGTMSAKCHKFKEILSEFYEGEIIMVDETLSSWEAKKHVENLPISNQEKNRLIKDGLDHIAAQMILMDYLEGSGD